MAKIHNYSSIADIQNFWITDIASQYFDFTDTNNYKVGMFGYINEVMSTVTQDAFNTINIAKREFYASTAEHIDSFYKMAGNYDIDVPLVVPGRANIVLFIAEGDIVKHGTLSDGTYTFIIDNSLEILADQIPFTLDYPIRILARARNDKYAYTSYYDTRKTNSLADPSVKYIQNKCVTLNEVKYLALNITARQYTITNDTQNITKNSAVETTSLVFSFDGDLAGFDIYYTENPGVSVEEFIPKYDMNDVTPEGKFCLYEFLADNKIRITFPKNAYFSPKMNSEIRCSVYTSMGEKGLFDEYLGDLQCTPSSEEYPYNNGLIIKGTVNGKCKDGINKLGDDDFKRDVRYAVRTNNTITTSSDLSEYFNNAAGDRSIRVEFEKQRDDVLERVYKSFILLKDDEENVIPTNSCNLLIRKSQFDEILGDRGIIKPGRVINYQNNANTTVVFTDLKLTDDLEQINTVKRNELNEEIKSLRIEVAAEENKDEPNYYLIATLRNRINQKENEIKKLDFLFTNPFLISVAFNNGIVGYYGNAISEVHSTEFTFVEDRSINQFICLGIQIERNPIAGEKYYTFTVKISSSSDMDPETLITMIDPEAEENIIRAKHDGSIVETFYKDGTVFYKLQYILEDGTIETEDIQVGTSFTVDQDTHEFTLTPGYSIKFNVLDTFVKDDIIAIKKVTDLGKLRACIDIDNSLINNSKYIPLFIEEYDEEKDAYTLRGYISTNDFISLNQTITLDHGIYNIFGMEDGTMAIPMDDTSCTVSLFYKDDVNNYMHNMWSYDYFKNYTLTNKYTTPLSENFSFVKGIAFFKSNLKYVNNTITETILAKGDGVLSRIYTEDNMVYCEMKYDEPVEIDDMGSTIESESILLRSGTVSSSGKVSYKTVFELEKEVGDQFSKNATIATKTESTLDGDDFEMIVTLSPLTRADWIKDYDNFNLLINKIYKTFDILYDAYFQLENQYGISMSLFNTYGRSARYEIGNNRDMRELNKVNCSINIGVEVDAMTNTTLFKEKFVAFIKKEIESFNDVDENGKSLFIIDLLAKAKEEFPEIQHLEYYGFNDYGTEAQVITPKEEEVTTSFLSAYVPEFINIDTENVNGRKEPKIHVSILNNTALI